MSTNDDFDNCLHRFRLGSTLFKMHKGENYLGFPDTVLGDKVEHCYHALALHENRPNFIDTRFEVKKNNLERGQHCKQVGKLSSLVNTF